MIDDFKDFFTMTPEEKAAKELCFKCKYGWAPLATGAAVYCDYLCKKGHRRECSHINCDKYEPRKKLRKGRKYD